MKFIVLYKNSLLHWLALGVFFNTFNTEYALGISLSKNVCESEGKQYGIGAMVEQGTSICQCTKSEKSGAELVCLAAKDEPGTGYDGNPISCLSAGRRYKENDSLSINGKDCVCNFDSKARVGKWSCSFMGETKDQAVCRYKGSEYKIEEQVLGDGKTCTCILLPLGSGKWNCSSSDDISSTKGNKNSKKATGKQVSFETMDKYEVTESDSQLGKGCSRDAKEYSIGSSTTFKNLECICRSNEKGEGFWVCDKYI